MTLRIESSARERFTVFTLSGRMEAEHVSELKELFDRDFRNIILDLRDLRLADRDALRFLGISFVPNQSTHGLMTEHRSVPFLNQQTERGAR